ncbi:hypothetical protein BX666DRAFT_1850453 [Dichotomocladium elegans]|nr:hypothetical protein BX666DRAFT_1850453 [Dichotomocladium elegans]
MSTEGEWTCLEKLLLAQSVYKLGENSWAEVASNLNHSSLLDRQPDFFQQEECFEQYSRLLDSIGKSEKPSVSATNHTDEPAVVVQIARELHIQRLEELRREIEETNEKYTTLTNEIHAIRDGKWDERLIAEEASKDQPKTTVSAHTELTIDDNDAIKMEPSEIDEQRQQKSWQKNINLLWREISNHKNGAMFMNPIKEATAPSYYDIFIKSTVEFERDIVLMLTNSLMYNKEGTEMYQMAVEMLEDVTEQVKLFKTADSNSPPVSHTRKASTIAKDRRKSISDF